jgi:hypothetical protein
VFVLGSRNVLYSHLADDAEFYAAAAMTGDEVAVASRTGYIYLLDAGTREIRHVTDIRQDISCISWDKARGLLWIGGESGSLGYMPMIPSNLQCGEYKLLK